MSKYKIKDLAVEISQRIDNPKTSGYDKFVGLEHYDSGEVRISRFGRTDNLDSSVKEFKSGDILIARRNVYLKRAGLVDFDGVTSGDSIVIRAKNDINKRLLPFVFNTKEFWDFANQFADGSMSKRLSPKLLMEYETALPDTEEERIKLADLLWSVFDTAMSYKEMIKQSDELVQSRFVEMFGDPTINSLQLNAKPLTQICEIIDGDRGEKYPKSDDFSNEGYCLFLNAKNVTSKGFNFDHCMFISKEKDELLRKGKLTRGDVILTTRGTIGNLAYYNDEVPFDQIRINSGMVILRMKQNLIDETYFIELFKMRLANIKDKVASGSAQPQLPISTMNKIQILIPNFEKQKEFSYFAKQVDKLKFNLQEGIEKLEAVNKKIMNQYLKKGD